MPQRVLCSSRHLLIDQAVSHVDFMRKPRGHRRIMGHQNQVALVLWQHRSATPMTPCRALIQSACRFIGVAQLGLVISASNRNAPGPRRAGFGPGSGPVTSSPRFNTCDSLRAGNGPLRATFPALGALQYFLAWKLETAAPSWNMKPKCLRREF